MRVRVPDRRAGFLSYYSQATHRAMNDSHLLLPCHPNQAKNETMNSFVGKVSQNGWADSRQYFNDMKS